MISALVLNLYNLSNPFALCDRIDIILTIINRLTCSYQKGTCKMVSELLYRDKEHRQSFSTFLDNTTNLSYFNIEMKIKISKFVLQIKQFLPLVLLVVLLSSMAITSFHSHKCTENSDNCTACNLQHSFSSFTIQSTAQSVVLPLPLSESLITLNERITDPSQKIVCSSHAPPQFS